MGRKSKQNKLNFIALSPPSKLITAARTTPSDIDNIILAHLQEVAAAPDAKFPSLAADIAQGIETEIHRHVTPPILWGGDPSWSEAEYRSCLVHATVLGRAFALSHLPSQDDPPRRLGYEIDALWKVMEDIFIEAFFTPEPEVGARYAAGILILTCSKDMAGKNKFESVVGKGKDKIWYSSKLNDENSTWTWDDIKKAVMGTKNLPRDRTRTEYTKEELQSIKNLEYIPQEVLDVLDKARKHLGENPHDLTAAEVMEAFGS